MTITGLVIIPISLAIIFLEWRYCILFLVVLSIFPAAAVVNIGNFGLQPVFFFSILIVVRTLIEVFAFRQHIDHFVIASILPLFLLLIISIITLWAGLVFFQGEVRVLSSTANFDPALAAPFEFRRGNLTQPLYLVLNMAIVFCLAHQALRMGPEAFSKVADRAIIGSILLASVILGWELLAQRLGVPFPSSFLHSNEGYAIAHTELFRATDSGSPNLLRASGSFPEPAAAGYFFGGCLFFSWRRFQTRSNRLSVTLVCLTLACLLVLKSSTAYITAFLFAIFAIFEACYRLVVRLRYQDGGFAKGTLLAVGLIILAVALSPIVLKIYWNDMSNVFSELIVKKNETVSYDVRVTADLMALDITVETIGVGLGLGSHKANSLITTLLSNVGVVGLAVFGVFLYRILWPRQRARHLEVVDGCADTLRYFVIGLLFSHVISNPNLNVAILWIVLGLLTGSHALVNYAARTGDEPVDLIKRSVAGAGQQ